MEILKTIKSEKSIIRQIKCLLQLNEVDLSKHHIKRQVKKLWLNFNDDWNATLGVVRSNYGKEFAFLIPEKICYQEDYKTTAE